MEHQKTLLILTFALLGILLLGQLGGLMEETPPETAVAEAYTGEPPVTVFGVVIREEAALPPLPEGDWVRWAVSGEKVAAGQILYAGSPPAERTEAARKAAYLWNIGGGRPARVPARPAAIAPSGHRRLGQRQDGRWAAPGPDSAFPSGLRSSGRRTGPGKYRHRGPGRGVFRRLRRAGSGPDP